MRSTENTNTAKAEALDKAILGIQRQFGAGSIQRLDGSVADMTGKPISSGSLGLDLALGVGGYPRGRVVEIYGPEASGKTTLALQAIASAQAAGGIAAMIDAEHAMDPAYAANLGVDLPKLFVSQPDSGEQALEIVEQLVRSSAVDLVVIDSVAALVPEAEISGQMGDLQVGLQARMMSKAMRKLTSVISKTNCTVIFINQLRQKIGVMFGPKEVTTGGNALKYYTSVRLDVRRIATLKHKDLPIGSRTRVRVVKNKVAAPFRSTEFDIIFGRGVCQYGELLDPGLEWGVIQKAGSWLSTGEERLGQGRENARAKLQGDPELMARLTMLVRAAAGLSTTDEDEVH